MIFAGTDEVIEFKHTAYSRAVFGRGSCGGGKVPGWKDRPESYDMSDVIQL